MCPLLPQMRFACHGMQQFWLNVSVTSSLVCNGCLSSEGFDNDLRVLGMDPRVLVRNGLKCLRNLSLISSTYIRKQAFPKLPQCCGHADPEHHLFSFSVFRNKSIYPPQKEALFLHGFEIIMSVNIPNDRQPDFLQKVQILLNANICKSFRKSHPLFSGSYWLVWNVVYQ